jgi:FtsZ-interacting cell division protein ZipA
MKKIIKILAIFSIAILLFSSCKTREKQVQKSETQTETKSEASAKIETKTFEIVQDKELSIFDKSNFNQNSETQKEQTKDIQVIREYYENGNLKSEINKSFSQLSEATKTAIVEMREKLTKETENSKYWEDSSKKRNYKIFQK